MKLRGFTKHRVGWLTGNRISHLSALFCLLAVPMISESTPLNWLLAQLFYFRRNGLHFHPHPPRFIPDESIGSASVKIAVARRIGTLNPPAIPEMSAKFRNVWTPPENNSAFKRRRHLPMTHQL